jgi:hypothetical protein
LTAPLDEKGLEAARDAFEEVAGTVTSALALRRAIAAYLSTVALPDELEVVAWAREVDINGPCLIDPAFVSEGSVNLFKYGNAGANKHARFVELVRRSDAADTLSQAHSTIAALRAERDSAAETLRYCERNWSEERGTMIDKFVFERNRAETAEAEVKRLTEEKEALRAELTKPDAQRRQWFIGDTLVRKGFINRADLVNAFGISAPQASTDIQAWLAANPGKATYNASAKRYEAAGGLNAPS